MTDDEILQIVYESVKRRQASMAADENVKDSQQRQMESDVEAKLRAIMGDVNVVVSGKIMYREDQQAWDISFLEDVPSGAPSYHYSFTINMDMGELLSATQSYLGIWVQSYLLGTMINVPVAAVDPLDPHWVEIAKTYLDKGFFYQGAEVEKVYSDVSVNSFCVMVEYQDGVLAQMSIDPATDELLGYNIVTDEMLYANSVNQ